MDQLEMTKVDRYDDNGAYFWRECDYRSSVYNPALVARYGLVLDRARGSRALVVSAGDGYSTARFAETCDNAIVLEHESAGLGAAKKMLADTPSSDCYQ